MTENLKETAEKTKKKDKDKNKPRRIKLEIQTPRGLWSKKSPEDAEKRPVYPRDTKIAQIIADARDVFKFTENDNKYVLLHGSTNLEPESTLADYKIANKTLLILSVQGGNA